MVEHLQVGALKCSFLVLLLDPIMNHGPKKALNDIDRGIWKSEYTLLGTNISLTKALWKNMFLFARWDMLVPCRVIEPHMAHFDEFSLSWQTDFLTHPLCYPSNYYVSAGQPKNHLQSHGQLQIHPSNQW